MQTKKFLSLLLALAMMVSLSVAASAAEEDAGLEGSIVILHTNDVHGGIAGYAKVAALKAAYEAKGAYTLLLDAGDYIQGDPTVSVSQGKTA
ncbi:MAG: bifunctional metallophosphatase/5'-nucleotidase, partial [Oscillibacter sp.]|nr:bifunctional metallophosphatase/5'-nucleotidase [Oscillibacter sp.]